MNKRIIESSARKLIKRAESEKEQAQLVKSYDEDSYLTLYLGTVFSIMPSGKYYLPFACSNVDACNRCKGKGCDFCGHLGSREAYEDSLMNDALDKYADKIGAWVESGEGDPCDLFVCWAVENSDEEKTI